MNFTWTKEANREILNLFNLKIKSKAFDPNRSSKE
jgi:hypothetical protein